MRIVRIILIAASLASSSVGAGAEPVAFPVGSVTLTAEFVVPPGSAPFPAVIALHGCRGMYARKSRQLSGRHLDWTTRLVDAGFAVLSPDSFTARGVSQICTLTHRPLTPEMRADDARAALAWLAAQPQIDPKRIALLGWSHGAMTTLWTVRPGFLDGGPTPYVALAFYPGCRQIGKLAGWNPSVPLTILIGAADDWTQPGPCRELAQRTGFRYIEYVDAYHDFDAPDTPVHMRTGLSAVKSGQAHIGTNPAARAAAIGEVMKQLTAAARPTTGTKK